MIFTLKLVAASPTFPLEKLSQSSATYHAMFLTLPKRTRSHVECLRVHFSQPSKGQSADVRFGQNSAFLTRRLCVELSVPKMLPTYMGCPFACSCLQGICLLVCVMACFKCYLNTLKYVHSAAARPHLPPLSGHNYRAGNGSAPIDGEKCWKKISHDNEC